MLCKIFGILCAIATPNEDTSNKIHNKTITNTTIVLGEFSQINNNYFENSKIVLPDSCQTLISSNYFDGKSVIEIP